MPAAITFRTASGADLPALADLRWRLMNDDSAISDVGAYERFVEDFSRIEGKERAPGEITHWVACADEKIVAAMSVIAVRKVPEPEDLHGRWGYLTNCYVLPPHRSSGVGSQLLQSIAAWAIAQALELLIVWPSDRSFPFYERSGFNRPADPLVRALK